MLRPSITVWSEKTKPSMRYYGFIYFLKSQGWHRMTRVNFAIASCGHVYPFFSLFFFCFAAVHCVLLVHEKIKGGWLLLMQVQLKLHINIHG